MTLRPVPIFAASPTLRPVSKEAPANQPDPLELGPAESRELSTWNDRFRPELGKLQSPPVGQGDLEKARRYSEEILRKVCGEELAAKGLEVRLEVFSGDIPQAGVDDEFSQEMNWNIGNPDHPWPIRTWYGVPKGEPFYRVGINAGLLRTLKTEDELAFILSQQVEHLLHHHKQDPENKEELRPEGKNFIEPGQMQAGADRGAVERMAKAGYNPHGALTALERLFTANPTKYSRDDQERALEGAAAGHEHEGLRVALVQSQVEDLKRSGHPSAQKVEVALPAGLAPPGPGLYEKPVDDFPTFQKNFVELADMLTQGTPAWMFDDNDPSFPAQLGYLRRNEGSTDDYETALLGVADHLKGKPGGGEAMLRLLLALEGECLPEDKTVRREVLFQLKGVLDPKMDTSAFLSSLQGPEKSLHQRFANEVQLNPHFQIMGDHLKDLTAAAPRNYASDPKTGELVLNTVADFYALNQDEPQSARHLAKAYDAATRNLVSWLPAEQLGKETDENGVPKAVSFSNLILSTKHQDAQELSAMRKSMAAILRTAHNVREDHSRLRLRAPLSEPEKVTTYLKELFASEAWGAFTPAFEEQLPAILLDVSRITGGQSGLISDGGRPQSLEASHERRLVSLYEQAQGEDKLFLLRTLERHWAHELRLPASSSRRAHTEKISTELAKQPIESLSQPDRSQHAELIKSQLTETYTLKPEDIPDTSTATLVALNERRMQGEFLPKRDDYPDLDSYKAALEAYNQRVDALGEKMKFLAPSEARLTLSPMAILGHDLKASAEMASKLNLSSFESTLAAAEEAVERSKTMRQLGQINDDEPVGVDAGGFLTEGFLKVDKEIETVDQWYSLAQRTKDICPPALEARPSTRRLMGDSLFPRLEKLTPDEIRGWLGKEDVLDLLAPDQSATLMLKVLGEKCAPEAPVAELAKEVEGLDTKLKLREEYPIVYRRLREAVSDKAKLQPSTVDSVFPEDMRNNIEEVEVFGKEVRGLSGLLAIARGRSPQEQLDTIEYLMGRQKVMPGYLETASEQQAFAPVAQALRNVRAELAEAEPMVRVMVANSFLAGPHGIMRNEQGREAVISHFLKGVPEKHQSLARHVGESIMISQGDADTLAVAYIMGQKPKPPAPGEDPDAPVKLDMAETMSRLFDSYGVPGIKMKQYLAFTAEFADFKEAFESAQDSALPLNYYQVLKLIQDRFGDEWPTDLKIDKVLGSGSVNVAIRYKNLKEGRNEVVSLGREDIEEATKYDFQRFQKFLDALTETPEDKEKFGYILGLLDLIRDSVELEFDKESVLKVQQQAYKSYSAVQDGWTVRSIDAYKVDNLGLFMEEAKGKTARKIFMQNPALYREAMRPMAKVEMAILRGQDSEGNWLPKPLFANPDFHDGQVLIDEPNKTVTILDFGQAVPIDNIDRECALDMTTIIGKGDSAKAGAKRLNKRFFEGRDVIKPEDVQPLLDRTDRMDIFIHLLSTLNRKGADVPLSSVHWVLGLNRQLKLGNKLGQSVQTELRNIVITHKVGLPLGVYNSARAIKDKVVDWTSGLAHTLIGWALPESDQPDNHGNGPLGNDDYSWDPNFGNYEPPPTRRRNLPPKND
jgi:hypothetical protein